MLIDGVKVIPAFPLPLPSLSRLPLYPPSSPSASLLFSFTTSSSC
jgi:hypothetical protein